MKLLIALLLTTLSTAPVQAIDEDRCLPDERGVRVTMSKKPGVLKNEYLTHNKDKRLINNKG